MQTHSVSEQKSSESGGIGTLRPVSPSQAFYFYTGIGQPVTSSSSSLVEFVQVVQSIDPASVQFHVQRGDFEQWFRSLGEQSLANQVAGLRSRGLSAQDLRTEISLAVGSRINELQQGQQQDQQQGQGQGSGGYQGSGGNQAGGSSSGSGSSSSNRHSR